MAKACMRHRVGSIIAGFGVVGSHLSIIAESNHTIIVHNDIDYLQKMY